MTNCNRRTERLNHWNQRETVQLSGFTSSRSWAPPTSWSKLNISTLKCLHSHWLPEQGRNHHPLLRRCVLRTPAPSSCWTQVSPFSRSSCNQKNPKCTCRSQSLASFTCTSRRTDSTTRTLNTRGWLLSRALKLGSRFMLRSMNAHLCSHGASVSGDMPAGHMTQKFEISQTQHQARN